VSFIDYRAFPIIADLVERLKAAAPDLAIEAISGMDCFSPSPERYIMDQNDVRLFILPVRWQCVTVDKAGLEKDDYRTWRPSVPADQLMKAAPLLAQMTADPLVVNALYSLSVPGCEIVPHIDRESAIGAVYRLHIGLRCPAGDCALIVDGERREWQDGEALLFDSARVEHSAHNRTRQARLIAIIDLDREAMESR
jgi:hypothetical protein